jgi:hypothetical protein
MNLRTHEPAEEGLREKDGRLLTACFRYVTPGAVVAEPGTSTCFNPRCREARRLARTPAPKARG